MHPYAKYKSVAKQSIINTHRHTDQAIELVSVFYAPDEMIGGLGCIYHCPVNEENMLLRDKERRMPLAEVGLRVYVFTNTNTDTNKLKQYNPLQTAVRHPRRQTHKNIEKHI